MNKKLIRLTESDLHRIVKESVSRILYEGVDNIKWTKRDFDEFVHDVLHGMVYGKGKIRTFTNEEYHYSFMPNRKELIICFPETDGATVFLENNAEYNDGKYELECPNGYNGKFLIARLSASGQTMQPSIQP